MLTTMDGNMNIQFENFPVELQSKTLSLVEFCADQLMDKELSDCLEIIIEGAPGLLTDDDELAYSHWEYEWEQPSDFRIVVDTDIKLRLLFTTIAHEMVHVKQYATEELKERFDPYTRHIWQGQEFITKDIDYYDRPWEIEAHGRETGLFIRWCEKTNLASEEWTQENPYN